jgi:hypothetical protein
MVVRNDPFETWLLQRLVRAVKAGEASAALPTELPAEIAETREQSAEEPHAVAIRGLAEPFSPPVYLCKEEVVLAQGFQPAALLNVWERKRVLTKAEALEEITRLREKPARAREKHHDR